MGDLLTGRTAVVTGGGRGIGRAVAIALARRGAAVCVADLPTAADEAASTVASIVGAGGQAWPASVDVRHRETVEQMYHSVDVRSRVADIVIANAGSSRRKSVLDSTDDDLAETIDVTVLGAFRTLQVGAQRLVAAGRPGAMLAFGSIHAVVPFPNALAYNVAKAGLVALCQSMAGELLPHGIAVNLVVPGLTDTPGERRFRTEAELRTAAAALPMGRLGTPEEVAELVAWVVSPANSYMTGSVIAADGGLSVSLAPTGIRSQPDRQSPG